MGITYHARFEKSKGIETFDLNSWAGDVFGALHGACGAQMAKGTHANDPQQLDWNWVKPYVPFKATAAQARKMAAVLKANRPVWEMVYDKWVRPFAVETNFRQWTEWVEEWISFLERCGGYRSI